MNVIEQARMGYAPAATAVRSPRSTEHQLFAQITARLRRAAHPESGDYGELVSALHENHKLWTTLAVDVAHDDNELPRQLRAQIFYLAKFTQQHTAKVLRKTATADALIDINRSVMAGLAGQEVSQ